MNNPRPNPIPVLSRAKDKRRRDERVRAEYRNVTRIPIEDALTILAIEACSRFEDGHDHLGTMWEAAHAYMDTHAQRFSLQANGGVMKGARRALSTILPETTCDDEFPAPPCATPEDEFDASLAKEWLMSCIDALDPRRRTIARHRLGLGEAADDAEMERLAATISAQRISQLWLTAETHIHRSWRAAMEGCQRALDPSHERCMAALQIMAERQGADPSPRPQRVRPKTIEPLRTTTTKAPPHVLRTCGVDVARVGHDSYSVDGSGSMDADGIGAMLHGLVEPSLADNLDRTLMRRDQWLANGFRGARRGTQWPHPVGSVPRLPLPDL